MKFNLKRPCTNCPFRKDRPMQRGWLGYDRAKEIAQGVLQENWDFRCHKTLHKPRNQQSMCAGALQMLHNATRKESPFGNQIVQIAERMGHYDPSKQDTSIPVFATIEEMAEFHRN